VPRNDLEVCKMEPVLWRVVGGFGDESSENS
jgi:hypothetical protein